MSASEPEERKADNVKYPYVLYGSGIRLLPIFKMTGDPFVLDLSNSSSLLKDIEAGDPVALHKALPLLRVRK